jgi:hypothetical protein
VRAEIGAAVTVALALVGLVGRPWASNDALWALLWGRQIIHGRVPTYGITESSTPHPLTNLLAAAANLLGADTAYGILVGIVVLAVGAIVVLTFQLGRECFGTVAGVVAAAVIATSPVYVGAGGSAQMDLVFIALILTAVLLAIRVRPLWAMGVLACAGLIRPDAWLLSGSYLMWLWWCMRKNRDRPDPPEQLALVLLAAAGPLVWFTADLIVTGHPLYALTYTQGQAHVLERTTGLRNVPSTARVGLEHILSPPALLGGLLGFIGALVTRRALPVLALGCLTGLVYLGYGAVGVSLLDRYLLLPAIVLAITLGYALTGWIGVRGLGKAIWAGGALLVIAYGATALDDRATGLRLERARVRANAAQVADLHRIASLPGPHAVLHGCRQLLVRDNRPVALLLDTLGRDPGEVEDARHTRAAPRDAFVTATAGAIAGNELGLFPDLPTAAQRPASFRVLFRDARWELSAAGRC